MGTCNIISEENKTEPTNKQRSEILSCHQAWGSLSSSTGSQEATLLQPSYERTPLGIMGSTGEAGTLLSNTRSQGRLLFPANFSIPCMPCSHRALASSLTPVSLKNPSFGWLMEAGKCPQALQVPSRQPMVSLGNTEALCNIFSWATVLSSQCIVRVV